MSREPNEQLEEEKGEGNARVLVMGNCKGTLLVVVGPERLVVLEMDVQYPRYFALVSRGSKECVPPVHGIVWQVQYFSLASPVIM